MAALPVTRPAFSALAAQCIENGKADDAYECRRREGSLTRKPPGLVEEWSTISRQRFTRRAKDLLRLSVQLIDQAFTLKGPVTGHVTGGFLKFTNNVATFAFESVSIHFLTPNYVATTSK
jgi:hypothetical protein